MAKWRLKFIPNIKEALGFGSIWASVFGLFMSLAEVILTNYHLMPDVVKAVIPHASPEFAILFGVVILARIFKIEKVEEVENGTEVAQ